MANLKSQTSDRTIETLQEVETYTSMARRFVEDWHTNIRRWRRWYDDDHYDKPAKQFEERYNDPTPKNTVDLAIGILLANDIEWAASGWEPDIGEESDSSDVEKYLAGTMYINGVREEYHIPYEVNTHFVRDGGAVLYTVWDKELAKQHKAETEGRVIYEQTPLRVQVIDPLQMYFLPGGPHRWSPIVREWKMSVYDVELLYGIRLPNHQDRSLADRMQTEVTVQDYWRYVKKADTMSVENALVADSYVLRPLRMMEGYDEIPYTVSFFKPLLRDNASSWQSIIEPISETVRFLEKAINRRNRQILIYTGMPLVSRTLPGRRPIRLDPALGSHVQLSTEESLEIPSWGGNAPDVQMHIEFMRSRLQQTGFADVMYGSGTSQVSGYALSQMGDQNRIRLEQPVRHLEMLWTNWARKVLSLTRKMTDGSALIRVYGQLRGQDFTKNLQARDLHRYMVKAEVKAKFPNEEVRKHAMATQAKGMLSESTIMERYLDIKQPDDERRRRLIDQAMSLPQMQLFSMMRLLLQAAKSEDQTIAAAAALTLQQLQGSMAGGQAQEPQAAEKPPMPNALGTQSATGAAPPQAGGAAPPGMA